MGGKESAGAAASRGQVVGLLGVGVGGRRVANRPELRWRVRAESGDDRGVNLAGWEFEVSWGVG